MSTDNHFEDVERGDDVPELKPLNPLVVISTTGTAQYNNDTNTNDDNTMNTNTSVSRTTSNEGNDDDASITSLLEAMGFNSDGPDYDSKQKRECEIAALVILSQNDFSTKDTPSTGELNKRKVWWRSPLHAASYKGLEEVVAKLLEPECGADLQLQDRNGNTAAFIALKEGHVELAKYFVEKGSTLNTINPLAWAILTCDDEDAALDILSRNPPTPDQLNQCVDWCFSPLHAAAFRVMEKVVDKLVECGADPELQDRDGITAAALARNLTAKESILNTINSDGPFHDSKRNSGGETPQELLHSKVRQMMAISSNEEILSDIEQEISHLQENHIYTFGQLVSAYIVYFYHAILIDSSSITQTYSWINETFVEVMKAMFEDERFLRFMHIPKICLSKIGSLDTYLRDILLSGYIEEKNLLGFTLGSQASGKTSFALSVLNRKAITSDSINDPDTGETLENTRILKIHENIQFVQAKSSNVQITENVKGGNVKFAKVSEDQIKKTENSTNACRIKLKMFDMGAHQEYNFLSTFFLSPASIFFILMDASKYTHDSYYTSVGIYVEEVIRRCPGATLMFFGNKMDKDVKSIFNDEKEKDVFLNCIKCHVTKISATQEVYPTVINNLFLTSCKEGINFEQVTSSIESILNDENISPARKEYPALWKTYQDHLVQEGQRNFIPEKRAKEIYEILVAQRQKRRMKPTNIAPKDLEGFVQLRQLIKECNEKEKIILENKAGQDGKLENKPNIVKIGENVNLLNEPKEVISLDLDSVINYEIRNHNKDNEQQSQIQDFQTVTEHLKESGNIVQFSSKNLKEKIFIPQTLVNTFQVFYKHDLEDYIKKELTRKGGGDFEDEVHKLCLSGHMSLRIQEGLFESRSNYENTHSLACLKELITDLGLGSMLKDGSGTLFVPSLVNKDIKDFHKRKQPCLDDMLQAEFFFDHGHLVVGVCEAIIVGLQDHGLAKFQRCFRDKLEDRTKGTVFMACGRLALNQEEIFVREDEISEKGEQFVRRRSVTLLVKPRSEVTQKTCQQFFNAIEKTFDTIDSFNLNKDTKCINCRILCNSCQSEYGCTSIITYLAPLSERETVGYFKSGNNPWWKADPREIEPCFNSHVFDDALPELANFLNQNEECPIYGAISKYPKSSIQTKHQLRKPQRGGGTQQTIINNYFQNVGTVNQTILAQLDHHLAKQIKPGQIEFLDKLIKEECLTTLENFPGTATSIIKIETILKSVCMMEGGSRATGFIAKIPNYGVAFMSAGHSFRDKTSQKDDKKLPLHISFNTYSLQFGNICGVPSKNLETCTLGDLGPFRGSIGYQGERRIFPGNLPQKATQYEDYCVLLFDERKLDDFNLSYLEVGKGNYLNYLDNGVVSIFGHPGERCTEGLNKRPLRVSYGKEKTASPNGSASENSGNFLLYDNDTQKGNSGSPVIGRGDADGLYAVKGIHVKGIKRGQTNGAQSLLKLDTWIPPHQIATAAVPVTSPTV